MSSDFELPEFFPLSIPIELDWLERLKQVALSQEIILVGDGITSREYACIFKKAGIVHTKISPQHLECWLSSNGYITENLFFLLAAPSWHRMLTKRFYALGLRPHQNFYTHFHALRNRMVIDLRGSKRCKHERLGAVLRWANSFPTIGGIDVLVTSYSPLKEISQLIASHSTTLHSKAILFPSCREQINISQIDGFDVIEINITHLPLQEEVCRYLHTLLIEIESISGAYLAVTAEMLKYCNASVSTHVFLDSSHAWYFDATLFACEEGKYSSLPNIKHGASNICLSRRMFPILDQNLRLKKCSLYDKLAKTNFDISNIMSNQFASSRNELCQRCTKYKLHRIA